MNLHTLFAIPRLRTPDKVALQFETPGQPAEEWSYERLHATADRLAAGLQAWGLHKGDRVAFYLGNRPEFALAYLAVIRLGAVMVPVNLRYRRGEITHILGDCTPRLLLTERSQEGVLAECDLAQSSVEEVLYIEEFGQWLADAPLASPPPVLADDLALIMYTSGTTGRSKGAMHSHNSVLATMTGLINAWAFTPQDVLLLVLPLFHTHGLVIGLHCSLAAGATIRLRPSFDLEMALGELGNGITTLFFAVPTIYVRLAAALEEMAQRPNLQRMRLFCSGSAPLSAETHQAFERLTGHVILERYGMTETGFNLSNPYAGPRIPGSVGLPLPGVSARIVDREGKDVAVGEEGNLLVRGSNVFSAYWNAPEKTVESFSHDQLGQRWFHTGDLARQDPATGYYTLLGRSHELIISGGFNIYPREIEEMLVTFPGVQEAAVVGAPHAEWGEVPVAYLVTTVSIDRAGLEEHCRRELASFKRPQAVYLLSELPRNAMGKVQKHLLTAHIVS